MWLYTIFAVCNGNECFFTGENSIVIVPGANFLLTEQDILNAETLIASSKVLICQLEICSSVSFDALKLAHKHGGMFVSF